MMIIVKAIFYILIFIGNFHISALAYDDLPITTDNRIKRYIYNPNEVYLLKLHHGFQSYIEFAKNEKVQTINIGDTYSWKINIIGNKIFIKSLEDNVKTNMTIITSKRVYQFDLISKILEQGHEDELIYAIKFHYPRENKR